MPANVGTVKDLFLAVLDLPAAERAAYLDAACAGDATARAEVEAMLRCHANSGELLARPAAAMLQDATPDTDAASAVAPADPAATVVDAVQAQLKEFTFLTPTEKPGVLGQLGPYEVQSVLGKGGFGVVFKAFDERLHRVVAIKVLAPAYAAVGSARKRFSREARAAAAVNNDHVVGIHDVQGDADPPYLVMEYIDGLSLQDKIDRHGPLSLAEILRIGMQIADGLAAAHAQGLVHRDIKPANILLENGIERVKITDFGLARTVDDASVTQSGTVAGTPIYMSPEQADGLQVDHRSDLFSLGTVLYAMCTGHPPFRAMGTVAVLKRVIEDTPRSIREINHEIPEWLCDIISKLHAKKPADRLQTAKAAAELLGARLGDVQAGRAVQVERLGAAAMTTKPARGTPEAAAGAESAFRDFAYGFGVFMLLVPVASAILFPLASAYQWDTRTTLLFGCVLFSVLALVMWGAYLVMKRSTLERWAWPMKHAAICTGILAFGSAVVWLGHSTYPQLATIELSFAHPTARVVLESADEVGRREFAREKTAHGKWVVDLPAGTHHLTVFVTGKQVASEDIVLTSGEHANRAIEPKGRLQVTNESEEPVTIYGLVEPGTQLPPDEATLPKVTRDVVGPHSALVDAKWAGTYRWVRGDEEGECFVAPGQTGTLIIPKKTEPGFIRLFNGMDLTGWLAHTTKAETPNDPSKIWEVKDNLILGKTGHGQTYLRTHKAYQNFILRLEYRCPPGSPRGRAGIALLGAGPDKIWPQSLQLDLAGLNGFSKVGLSSITWDQFTPPSAGVGGDEWWPLEIVGRNGAVEFFFKGISFGKVVNQGSHRGYIGFFTEQRELQLRNIRIKELPPNEPGWVQLFNGSNFTGWKADKAQWTIKDGVIIADSAGHLVSERLMPRDFQLRMEVKLKCGVGALTFRRPSGDWVFDLMDNRLGMVDCMMISQGQLPHKATEIVREVAKLDEWVVLDLIARDQQTRVEINGKHVAFLHDGNYKPAPGHIGLWIGNAVDSDPPEMHVRKIEVTAASPPPP